MRIVHCYDEHGKYRSSYCCNEDGSNKCPIGAEFNVPNPHLLQTESPSLPAIPPPGECSNPFAWLSRGNSGETLEFMLGWTAIVLVCLTIKGFIGGTVPFPWFTLSLLLGLATLVTGVYLLLSPGENRWYWHAVFVVLCLLIFIVSEAMPRGLSSSNSNGVSNGQDRNVVDHGVVE